MSYKLDIKDRKILYELDSDSRQSASRIAKKVGLSTEVVNYRIRKLEEKGIITGYMTIIDLSKLGIIQFKICISLQYIDSKKIKDVIEDLKKLHEVKWIVSCKGEWDLIISLETGSFTSINDLKNKVLEYFEGHLDKKSLAILIEGETYNRDYLFSEEKNNERKRLIMNDGPAVKIDDTDLKILKIVSKNSRKQVIEIAEEIGVTARIADYRIRQMIKEKIILGFKISIDYEKLGILFYKTFIHIDNPKGQRIKQLKKYLEHNKNVIHNGVVLGNWDMEPEFEVFSEQEFDDLLRDIKDRFLDIIKKIDIITITKEHKFEYF